MLAYPDCPGKQAVKLCLSVFEGGCCESLPNLKIRSNFLLQRGWSMTGKSTLVVYSWACEIAPRSVRVRGWEAQKFKSWDLCQFFNDSVLFTISVIILSIGLFWNFLPFVCAVCNAVRRWSMSTLVTNTSYATNQSLLLYLPAMPYLSDQRWKTVYFVWQITSGTLWNAVTSVVTTFSCSSIFLF